jgi:hypothetical protein
VSIPAALAAALATLTEALDEPGIDIASTPRTLGADAALAVSSYLGLTVTAMADGHPVSFTDLRGDLGLTEAATSLRMALPPTPTPDAADPATMTLVLYAATPGAFVDLAADLRWLTGAGPDSFVLDADLNLSDPRATAVGVAELSAINQAVGMLLGSGHSIEQAHGELDRLAAEAGTDSHTAALGVLGDAERGQPPWRAD